MSAQTDLALWDRALALAQRSIGLSEPNPRVGCVISDPLGQVIGEGFTQQAGGPHAEVMALRDVLARGASARGATAWVTLEPCAHFGRTPPCCDALVQAGIAEVRVALADPFPQVAGRGIARLREAGIEVHTDVPAAVAQAAFELNIGFFSRVLRARPWVRLKAAVSLDGRTALANGQSQWITGPAARADGHAWRRRAGAVLTGFGTVRDDDPRLDVREVETSVQPVRVVVDSRLETLPTARILAPPGRVWIAHTAGVEIPPALARQGCEFLPIPAPEGKTDLACLLEVLGGRGINELHVEAGHKLNGSWLRAGLVDELLVYVAPRLLGEGAGLAALGPFDALADGPMFRFTHSEPIGPDVRLRAVKASAYDALQALMPQP